MGFEFSDKSYTVDTISGDLIELAIDPEVQRSGMSTVDRTIQDLATIFTAKEPPTRLPSGKIDHIISLVHACKEKIPASSRMGAKIERVLTALQGLKSKAGGTKAKAPELKQEDAPTLFQSLPTEFQSFPAELQRKVGRAIGHIESMSDLASLNDYVSLYPKLIPSLLFKQDAIVQTILDQVQGDVTKIPAPLCDAVKAARLSITEIKLDEYPLTAVQLKSFAELFSKVQGLSLQGCNLQNDGLAELESLTSLTSLTLSNNQDISAVGLIKLAKLTHLEVLDLSNCQHVDDDILKSFGGMEELHTLNLNGCSEISDVGFGMLQRLPKLKTVNLSSATVTNVAIAELGQSKNAFRALTTITLPIRPGISPRVLSTLSLLPKMETCVFTFPEKNDWKCECTFKNGHVDSLSHGDLKQLSLDQLATLFSFVQGSNRFREEFMTKLTTNNYALLGHIIQKANSDINQLPDVLREVFLKLRDKVVTLAVVDWKDPTVQNIEQLTAHFPKLQRLDLGWCTIATDEAQFTLSDDHEQLSLVRINTFFSLIKNSKPLMEKFTAKMTADNYKLLTHVLRAVDCNSDQLPEILKKLVLENKDKITHLSCSNPTPTVQDIQKVMRDFPNLKRLETKWFTIANDEAQITLCTDYQEIVSEFMGQVEFVDALDTFFSLIKDSKPLWNKFATQLVENENLVSVCIGQANGDTDQLSEELKRVFSTYGGKVKNITARAVNIDLVRKLQTLFPNLELLDLIWARFSRETGVTFLERLLPGQELLREELLLKMSFRKLTFDRLNIALALSEKTKQWDTFAATLASDSMTLAKVFYPVHNDIDQLPTALKKTLQEKRLDIQRILLLENFQTTAQTQSFFKTFPHVKDLYLLANGLSQEVFQELKKAINLTRFSLHYTRDSVENDTRLITDQAVADLFREVPHLEHLSLVNCHHLTNEAVRRLPSQLHYLDISGNNQITEEGLALLTQSKLQQIVLPLAITYNGLQSIAKLHELRAIAFHNVFEIDMAEGELPSQVTNDILKALKGCSQLKDLNLHGCLGLTLEGIIDVVQSLRLDCLTLPVHLQNHLAELQRTFPQVKITIGSLDDF